MKDLNMPRTVRSWVVVAMSFQLSVSFGWPLTYAPMGPLACERL
jgi:hypothetical protein